MSQQILMVLTGLTAGILLLSGFFLFRHFFPRRKINYLFLLFLTSLLPCLSIFRNGVYESGDFSQHIYRAMVFTDILKESILIPSWGHLLNAEYGYPVFIFIYHTPYYLLSLFHSLGFTFVFSGKLLLTFAFIGSGLIMYAVLKKLTKNVLAAFAGSVVYLFSPYHLVDLHFRVAIAEIIGFVIAPAIFYLILKLQEKIQVNYILWLGFLFGIFFLDHPAQFIFYTGLFFVYLLYQILFLKKKYYPVLFSVSAAFIIGLFISSYSWIARFTLSQFTHGSLLMHIPVSFTQPWELLFSPWRYGLLFQGPHGELSFLIGYSQIFILLFGIYMIMKSKLSSTIHKQFLFWMIMACMMVVFILPFSKAIWDLIPFLNLMQFSYRLLHPIIFCLAIITAYIVLHFKIKKKIIFIFILFTIGYTILNWGNRGMVPTLNDVTLRQNIPSSTRLEEGVIEANPLWYSPTKYLFIQSPPKNHLEILKGKGEIKETARTSAKHTYIVYGHEPLTLLENTFYFPDWTIMIDGKKTSINYTTEEYPGRMVFSVPQGVHQIEVSYADIPALKTAKIVSLLTIIIILSFTMLFIYHKIRQKT